MRKTIARMLVRLARWIYQDIAYVDAPSVRPMGITLHVSKKDVSNWRKEHPEIRSFRQSMKSIVEEAKWRVAGAIGRGLIEKKAIHYDISSTFYTADVSGMVYLYAQAEETAAEES